MNDPLPANTKAKHRLKDKAKTKTLQDNKKCLSFDESNLLTVLEKCFSEGQRDSIAALREIRERRLFRERYSTFDEYMSQRWNRTRQWATQQIGWLRRQELLEELAGEQFGKAPYQLTVAEAQVLSPLEPEAETLLGRENDAEATEPCLSQMFVDAVLEAQKEADAVGKKRTVEMTKRAVQKRMCFLENRQVFGGELTLEESEQLARLEGQSNATATKLLRSARQLSEKQGSSSDSHLKKLIDELLVEQERSTKSEPHKPMLRWSSNEDEDFVVDVDSDDSEGADTLELDQTETDSLDQFDIELTGNLVELAGNDQIRVNECETIDLLKRLVGWFENRSFCNGGVQITLVRNTTSES